MSEAEEVMDIPETMMLGYQDYALYGIRFLNVRSNPPPKDRWALVLVKEEWRIPRYSLAVGYWDTDRNDWRIDSKEWIGQDFVSSLDPSVSVLAFATFNADEIAEKFAVTREVTP